MSAADKFWDELAKRAVHHRSSGITTHDDDLLGGPELREAALRPGKAAAGAAGAPGMMPPMMGGAGHGTTSHGNTAGTGLSAASSQSSAAAPAGGTSASLATGSGAASGGVGVAASPQHGGPSGSPAPPAPAPVEGFIADPEQLKGLGNSWTELAQDLRALPPATETRLGVVKAAERNQAALSQQLTLWKTTAADEFDSMVSRLQRVASDYTEATEASVAVAKKAGVEP